jgi:hypothetical protein
MLTVITVTGRKNSVIIVARALVNLNIHVRMVVNNMPDYLLRAANTAVYVLIVTPIHLNMLIIKPESIVLPAASLSAKS